MDTEIAQTPKMWESCVNSKTTYSIIVDGCWKRPKFQSAAFQGLGFLIFDQCSMLNYWSEGSNPSSSVALHEIGHNLGLDHEEGTLMSEFSERNQTLNNQQRLEMSNKFENQGRVEYRNTGKESMGKGDSSEDLFDFLNKGDFQYNFLFK